MNKEITLNRAQRKAELKRALRFCIRGRLYYIIKNGRFLLYCLFTLPKENVKYDYRYQ